jgi:hypothetical protein
MKKQIEEYTKAIDNKEVREGYLCGYFNTNILYSSLTLLPLLPSPHPSLLPLSSSPPSSRHSLSFAEGYQFP